MVTREVLSTRRATYSGVKPEKYMIRFHRHIFCEL